MIADSIAHHVSSEPRTMTDSLRRPLPNGIQKAVNTDAAAHTGHPWDTAVPSRGSRTRLRMYQDSRPQARLGRCIHSIDVETDDDSIGGHFLHLLHGKPASKAFDVVPLRNGKPVWGTSGDGIDDNPADDNTDDLELWQRIGQIGESLGLEWAGRWKTMREFPHFQLKE